MLRRCGGLCDAACGLFNWGRIWNLAAPMFNFTASKFVVIKDWRLGVTLRGLQAAIVVYLIFNIVLEASYLAREIPTGVILAHAPSNNRVQEFSDHFESIQSNTLPYCDKPEDYNFKWSNQTFEDFKCTIVDSSTLTQKGEDEYFITTYFSTEKVTYATKADDGSCPKAGDQGIPKDAEKIFEKLNACIYSRKEHHFPVIPEDVTLDIIHGYMTTNAIDKSGSLPRTILVSKNESLPNLEIPENKGLRMTVKRLLEYANVALDKDITDNEGTSDMMGDADSEFAGQYPKPRLTGVNLVLDFSYYQRKMAPKPYKRSTGKRGNEILCLVEIYPLYRWSMKGADISFLMRSASDPVFLDKDGLPSDLPKGEVVASQLDMRRNGIVLSFQTRGLIGRFSTSALIAALVAGSVMLGIAQILVTFVALYALGLSSQLYREFLRESVDWRKEYARYAAQALVAGFAFMSYDRDHSGKLDRREIFKVLNTVIGHRLSDEKVAALTDFLMRQGETDDEGVAKGKFAGVVSAGTISIEEWIDIFTEEKCNLAALKRLIDMEYTEEKDLISLKKMAMKRSVKDRALPADLLESLGIPLLQDEEGNQESEEESEEEMDPDYVEYTQNKRRFFLEFFLSNDPKVAEPLPSPQVEPSGHVDIDFSGLDDLVDNDIPTGKPKDDE
ncbi:hypothetical protein BSKO_08821 [Bryopsis sp. KO-2023]|nr:hypothetical protein BSKO_08821 [Bryopsis sp. KO-2023]